MITFIIVIPFINNLLSENIAKFFLSSSIIIGINKNFFFVGIDGKIFLFSKNLKFFFY
jgi:hypothetical protein